MSRWKGRFAILTWVPVVVAMGMTEPAHGREIPLALGLFEAINEGDVGEVQRLLGLGVSLERDYLMEQTPYQYAIRLGRREIIKILFREANTRRREGSLSAEAEDSETPETIGAAIARLEETEGLPSSMTVSLAESVAFRVDLPSVDQPSDDEALGDPVPTPDDPQGMTAATDAPVNPAPIEPNDRAEDAASFSDWAAVIFGPPPEEMRSRSAARDSSDSPVDDDSVPAENPPQLTLGDRRLGAPEPESQANCRTRNSYKICRVIISWVKKLGRVVRTDEALAVYSDGRARGYFVFFAVDLFAGARDYLTARFGPSEKAEENAKKNTLGLGEDEWWASEKDTNHILSLRESAGYKHINLRVDQAMLSLVEEGFEDTVSLLRMTDLELALTN